MKIIANVHCVICNRALLATGVAGETLEEARQLAETAFRECEHEYGAAWREQTCSAPCLIAALLLKNLPHR